MSHTYNIAIVPVAGLQETTTDSQALEFVATNHDDLFEIVEKMRAKSLLPENEVAEFCIGLKLFAEVAMRHRKDPLFSELWPHLGTFMKGLKAHGEVTP